VRNLTRSAFLCAIALTLAGALLDAGTHTKSSSNQPSSYAPRKHSTSHVYGSPIGRPVVSRNHSTKPRVTHSTSHYTYRKPPSERAIGVTRDNHGTSNGARKRRMISAARIRVQQPARRAAPVLGT
jgi:hypothetical protein